jgi:hypothetical protein
MFTLSRCGKLSPYAPHSRCLSLQNFLPDKLARWAVNGFCVEEISKNFTESFIPH